MKNKNNISKNGILAGAIAGVIVFAIVGFLPGSFIGGVIGLNIAKILFGAPLNSELAPRLITAVSMVSGVVISGLITIFIFSMTGLAGARLFSLLNTLRKNHTQVAIKG